MIHLKQFPHWHVLPYTRGKHPHERTYTVNGKKYKVYMRSSRFKLFSRSRKCVCCGLVGKWMVLDLCKGHSRPHFNLYGKRKGKLILFTRDHIVPKSKGGGNNLSNYQTMCVTCNGKKKNDDIGVEELRRRIGIRR